MKLRSIAKALGAAAAMATALVIMGTTRASDVVQSAPAPQPVVAAPAEPAAMQPAPKVDEPVVELDGACDDENVSSNASTLADDPMIAPEDTKTEAAGCKPCKGRTWCKCTYNGMQRSSCDPCCYRNDIGFQICLD